MDEKKSVYVLGRRDVLKLIPQTAASWSLLPRSGASDGAPVVATVTEGPEESNGARSQGALSADWIWEPIGPTLPGSPERVIISKSASFRNLFTYFRKTVNIPGNVRSAKVQITGDSRYKLYVNGQYVGRGPVRSSRVWQYFDEFEVGTLLRPGNNVFAVVLHFYGENTGWYMLSRPGLLFQAEVGLASGQTMCIQSDATWKFWRSKAYVQDTPRKNGALGFVEVYDARQEQARWRDVEFDDSAWPAVAVVSRDSNSSDMPRVLPAFPPENLIPRSIPMLTEQEVLAARVIQTGETQNLPPSDALSPAEQMSREPIDRLTCCNISNVGSLAANASEDAGAGSPNPDPKGCRISTVEGKSAVLVLDFGREVTGYPRLELDGVEGGVVDLGISESLLAGRVTPTRNGLHCNRYVMRDGRQIWEAFEWDGFRYLQLTVRNCLRPVVLRRVAVNFTSYPVGNRGVFESNDVAVNRIWETCRHTLQLCMHDAYEDCPNREQRQWVGDAYVESKVNYAIFGDTKLAEKFLRQTAQSQRSDGIIGMYYPGDLDNEATLSIKDFVLHWTSALWEFYRFTGDLEILSDLYPNLNSAVGWFVGRVGPHGLLCDVPPWIFYDWAELDKRGESTVLNALFYNVLRESAQIASVLGKTKDQARFNALADRVKLALNERLWDERRGVYVDARVGDHQSRRVSQHANALCLLHDIASPEKRLGMIDYIFAEQRVKGWEGPSIPALITSPLHPLVRSPQHFSEESDVVQAQPFFLHWVNAALAHVGEHDRMLGLTRQGFGSMLDAGATTIWETWSADASECHGWSTTAAYDLMTYILGVRAVAAGFAAFAIEPHPAGLEWARGRVPSMRGDIPVSWENSEKQFRIAGEVPEGCAASVLVPLRNGGWPTRVALNGEVSEVYTARKEKNGTRIPLVRPGPFKVSAMYG